MVSDLGFDSVERARACLSWLATVFTADDRVALDLTHFKADLGAALALARVLSYRQALRLAERRHGREPDVINIGQADPDTLARLQSAGLEGCDVVLAPLRRSRHHSIPWWQGDLWEPPQVLLASDAAAGRIALAGAKAPLTSYFAQRLGLAPGTSLDGLQHALGWALDWTQDLICVPHGDLPRHGDLSPKGLAKHVHEFRRAVVVEASYEGIEVAASLLGKALEGWSNSGAAPDRIEAVTKWLAREHPGFVYAARPGTRLVIASGWTVAWLRLGEKVGTSASSTTARVRIARSRLEVKTTPTQVDGRIITLHRPYPKPLEAIRG